MLVETSPNLQIHLKVLIRLEMALPWPGDLRPKDYLILSVITLVISTLPFLAIFSLTIYAFAFFASFFFPSYGKFINYFDAWMEEDFVDSIPRNSVVTTLTLQGDMSVEELRSIFHKNVLEIRSKINPRKIRYPELRQYLTTFLGFRIWKCDPSFLIENHIVEKLDPWDGNLNGIHQEQLNKPYNKERSPWEIILIRNVNLSDDDEQENNNEIGSIVPKSVLVCRVHHVLADGKSLLKLFVECLGRKQLKTASPQSSPETLWDKVLFFMLFPLNYVQQIGKLFLLLPRSHRHPWKVQGFNNDKDVKTVVAFSSKLLMSDIKQVAKRNGVTSSAVMMNIVTGGIRRCSSLDGWDREVAIGYPFPKPDHPEGLTNHVYMGIMKLPTDEEFTFNRLQECNKVFLKAKKVQQGRYIDFFVRLAGIQIFPLTRLGVNQFTPTGEYLKKNKKLFSFSHVF